MMMGGSGSWFLKAAGLLGACAAIDPLSPEQIVDRAHVVAVVAAPATYAIEPDAMDDWLGRGMLDFRTVRLLHGRDPGTVSVLGNLVEEDEFNEGPVPYAHVRPSGEGSCIAYTYRPGSRYLFLMQFSNGKLTPYWAALGPTNEQLQPVFRRDPWFQWVHRRLGTGRNNAAQQEIAAAFDLILIEVFSPMSHARRVR